MSVIKVKDVSKSYGDVCVLDHVTLTIEENKIYGLLGRNGVGKTTLLNLITNRLFPTAGEITIDGEPVMENDHGIGKIFYMAESNLYPENMKVSDVFKWTKEFYPSFDSDYALSLCQKFELDSKKKVKGLSTGYRTISKIITALASNAPVVLFDEPILGLDAHHRELFYKELLKNFIEKPKTILLSTHIIDEIAHLLERVIVIKEKKMIVNDSVEHLLKTAYCVSGSANNIDTFVSGKNCIYMGQMASFKEATILGEVSNADKELAKKLQLEFLRVELQKLFIHLTNPGGAKE